MSIKRIFPLILTISITSLVILFTAYNNYSKHTINTQIINQVNSEKFLNSDITNYSNETKILTPINFTTSSQFDNSYQISIDNIQNGKLSKKTIEQNIYHTYSFDATLEFSKNDTNYIKTINSNIIVEKVNNKFIIKSIDDLKQDIIKELMAVKNENSEDISKELSDISLIYQNDELDIQLNYPNYYTYNTNIIFNDSNNSTEHTASFYMNDDKTSNYILLSMQTNCIQETSEIIDDFITQNYSLITSDFITPNNISFTVLTQNFTQDFKEVTEIVFIAKNDYKTIDELVITVKIDTAELSKKQSEIEEIIKSIK